MYFAPADLASLTHASASNRVGLNSGGSFAYSTIGSLSIVHHPLALAQQRIDAPVDEQAELGVLEPAPRLGIFFAHHRVMAGRLRASAGPAPAARPKSVNPEDQARSARRVARRSRTPFAIDSWHAPSDHRTGLDRSGQASPAQQQTSLARTIAVSRGAVKRDRLYALAIPAPAV